MAESSSGDKRLARIEKMLEGLERGIQNDQGSGDQSPPSGDGGPALDPGTSSPEPPDSPDSPDSSGTR